MKFISQIINILLLQKKDLQDRLKQNNDFYIR